ncbi:TolC family protein [Candidatus Poribacteria bacterium]|nr:TolC family protein [Candidatus Poribacteria bacterium]MYH80685.1 TolC family protein [Candidatus Poribacteria bacterium]MYK96430.1 TolC family protein [Candidatus Poribacteria bacterium]
MRTKTSFNHIFIIVGFCLLTLIIVQIPSAFSNGESRISLEIAIETALRENPQLNTIRERVHVVRARVDGIALLGNPKLETEFVGGVHAEQSFELTKAFELGGQRGHRIRIAKTHLEKVDTELAAASQSVRKSVKIAFYELLLVQEKLKLAKEIVQYTEQMRDIAQTRFETGDLSVTQANLSNIHLQSALREAVMLENKLQLAQLSLNELMGAPLETARVVVGELREKASAETLQKKLTLDALKTQALAYRNDLKSLRLNAQLTESELRLAKATNIPDLSVGALAERSVNERAFGVKFSIPLPLFNRNRGEINATKAQQQVDTVEINNTEKQIVREVMAAFLSFSTTEKMLTFYEGDSLKLLNENLKLTRTAYELGETELLEVILMQKEFIKARFAYLDVLAAYHKAFAELEAAVGTSLEPVP